METNGHSDAKHRNGNGATENMTTQDNEGFIAILFLS